ncbi:hypothetical protein MCOR02_002034 [Pyricularia oryzae]|nr:hypothetical protein MCOR02_002034 [Pyricularia oryzae]
MLSSLSRVSSRKAISTVSRLAKPTVARTFMTPTVSRRADFVQELYLKELKAYKPTPIKESDSQGQVATFNLPQAPSRQRRPTWPPALRSTSPWPSRSRATRPSPRERPLSSRTGLSRTRRTSPLPSTREGEKKIKVNA